MFKSRPVANISWISKQYHTNVVLFFFVKRLYFSKFSKIVRYVNIVNK